MVKVRDGKGERRKRDEGKGGVKREVENERSGYHILSLAQPIHVFYFPVLYLNPLSPFCVLHLPPALSCSFFPALPSRLPVWLGSV